MMATETTAKQNIIIWSVTSFVILILCGIIGWLINGKDIALSNSINGLIASQTKYMEKAEDSDRKIMDSFQDLCKRVGDIDSRVGNLEIYIQMPFSDRENLLKGKKK